MSKKHSCKVNHYYQYTARRLFSFWSSRFICRRRCRIKWHSVIVVLTAHQLRSTSTTFSNLFSLSILHLRLILNQSQFTPQVQVSLSELQMRRIVCPFMFSAQTHYRIHTDSSDASIENMCVSLMKTEKYRLQIKLKLVPASLHILFHFEIAWAIGVEVKI